MASNSSCPSCPSTVDCPSSVAHTYPIYIPPGVPQRELFEFYDRLDFVYGSFTLSWDETKKKKVNKYTTRWSTQEESMYDCTKNALYIITGYKSNITVIDIDKPQQCQQLMQ